MILKYFKKIDKILENYNYIIEDFTINKNELADDKGIMEGEIFFVDGTILMFLEVNNTNKKDKVKYKYHFMDKKKQLIFRYDNAKHHRDIKTFPCHIVTGVIENKEPNLEIVLEEIQKQINDY